MSDSDNLRGQQPQLPTRMPYAQSSGSRIHYRVEGTGPPIVMVHGFSDSLVDWYEAVYVDALRDDYRLVLIDCRGHGLSDKPHAQEAYTVEMRVVDVHGRRFPMWSPRPKRGYSRALNLRHTRTWYP